MSRNERLAALHGHGVAIWIDALGRDDLETGRFERLLRDMSVTGVTSNPATFDAALHAAGRYREHIASLVERGERSARELFLSLALADVQAAADQLEQVHEATQGRDGFVSFECTPDVADDTLATVGQATALHRRIDRPNVMIKVPATSAGIEAITLLTADGISVNVTLLFSVDRYSECLDAYLAGLEARLALGRPLAGIASVASLFLSRLDARADAVLPEGSDLRGEVALANAAAVLRLYRRHLGSARWKRLAAAGGQAQRPLWASVAPKSDRYPDVHYVERLVAPDTIVTMPPETLDAFADHGEAVPCLDQAADGAAATLVRASRLGVDVRQLARDLEREGVAGFSAAYARVLRTLSRHVEEGGPASCAGDERPLRPAPKRLPA